MATTTRQQIRTIGCLFSLTLCTYAVAQERFELFGSGSTVVATAYCTPQTLQIIELSGDRTDYSRDRHHDTGDGLYRAYSNSEATEALLWPVSGSGCIHIGEPSASTGFVFRESKIQIRPVDQTPGGATGVEGRYRLTSQACETNGLYLTSDNSHPAVMARASDVETSAWSLVSVGGGYYRVLRSGDKRGRCLSVADGQHRLSLESMRNSMRQLWRIKPIRGRRDYYRVISAAPDSAGMSLEAERQGSAMLARTRRCRGQCWKLIRLGAVAPVPFGGYRVVSRRVTPNSPLPAARVEMANGHSKEIWILITDLRNLDQSKSIKIPAGGEHAVMLDRDAGSRLVEVCEEMTATGVIRRREMVTQIPPAALYDVSVYELFLQSVAIDRTVPGGKLEDVNYSPKSVGWFVVPPGETLADGQLDIYQIARRNHNPGQVRRIDPRQWQDQPQTEDSLERLLRQLK